MSVQPFSEAARGAARSIVEGQSFSRPGLLAECALEAAHDREALGLDASARIGDILGEVVGMLRERDFQPYNEAAAMLIREFGASHDR